LKTFFGKAIVQYGLKQIAEWSHDKHSNRFFVHCAVWIESVVFISWKNMFAIELIVFIGGDEVLQVIKYSIANARFSISIGWMEVAFSSFLP